MPLTGEAKRAYQRTYMRQSRRVLREAAKQAQAVGVKVSGAALQAAAAVQVSQVILKDGLDRADLPLDVSLQRVRQLHDAVRPYGKEAIDGPDNDARARACDIALRLHERAGTIPSAQVNPGGGASITVIEVNYHIEGHVSQRQIEDQTALVVQSRPDRAE